MLGVLGVGVALRPPHVPPAKGTQMKRKRKSGVIAPIKSDADGQAAPTSAHIPSTPRIRIEITPDAPPRAAVDLAIRAISKPLFRQGAKLVHVRGGAIVPATRHTLSDLISTRCEIWEQRGDVLKRSTWPSKDLVNAVLHRGIYPAVRPLRAVAPQPCMVPGGRVLTEPGYDAESGIYVLNHGLKIKIPGGPDGPTRGDALKAIGKLESLVDDFPWRETMHRTAWIAALLTVLTIDAHSGNVPAFLIDADLRGCGKTLLVSMLSWIALGQDIGKETWREGGELRKLITTAVVEGRRIQCLDNITTVIRGAALDIATTTRVWQDRILGKSAAVSGPPPLIIMTGNRAQVASDTTRRVIAVRLKSKTENPEHRRDFSVQDIITHVREHRTELLCHALTILCAYEAAKRPAVKVAPLGSYEAWTAAVCAPVVWLDRPNPIDTQKDYTQGPASDVAKLTALLLAWRAVHGDAPLTASQALDALRERDAEPKMRSLRDALVYADLGDRLGNAILFGISLRGLVGRTAGGLTLVRDGKTREDKVRWLVKKSERRA